MKEKRALDTRVRRMIERVKDEYSKKSIELGEKRALDTRARRIIDE